MAVPLLAQTPTPAERLEHIREINSLDAEGLKPWHFKVSFKILDTAGREQKNGILEEWWRDSGNWRRVFTQSDSTKAVFVSVDGKLYKNGEAAHIPTRVDMLLQQYLRPVAPALPQAIPELRHRDFGKITTDCIMLSQPTKGEVPLGMFPTYCVADDDALRLSWLFRTVTLANNRPAKFQSRSVPLEVIITSPGIGIVRGIVEDLRTIPPSDVDLSTGALIRSSTDLASRVSSGVVAGMKIGGPPPEYPMAARQNHSSGMVLMKATIGKDGHIRELKRSHLQMKSSPAQP